MGLRRYTACLVVLVGLLVCSSRAQFLGYVSQQTVAPSQVFTAQAANGVSGTLINLGQSTHLLNYCTTNFGGTISLEASPDGTFTTPTVIATATYGQNSVVDTGCHVLPAGGYFQTVRARVSNYTAGSVNAWYTGVGGPTAFAPAAFGSNGPTAPVACDKNTSLSLSPSTNVALIGVFSGANIYICQASIAFNGTTSTGAVTFQEGTDATCGTILRTMWQSQVTASSPQTLPQIGGPLGAFTRTTTPGHAVCVSAGAITANAIILVSYAQF